MKIRPMGAELFHADRRTDGRTDTHDEATVIIAFRKFTNAPKNEIFGWARKQDFRIKVKTLQTAYFNGHLRQELA